MGTGEVRRGGMVRRLRRLFPLRELNQHLHGIANSQDGIEQRLREVVAGLDNQSKILSRLAAGIDELRELQRAQLVMQRDQVEAIEQLAATVREPASPAAHPAAPDDAAGGDASAGSRR